MTDVTPPAAPGPWPILDAERLADAVGGLAESASEPALRAQLHALATVLGSLPAQGPGDEVRGSLERALDTALERGDDAAVVAAARTLAARDRTAVQSVDWSAVSGG
jgi:hypothetical protein